MEPLLAIGAYFERASSIFSEATSEFARLSFTALAIFYDSYKFYIRSTSSNIFPLEFANNSNILSSFLFRLAFPVAIVSTNSFFTYSISGISLLTTSPSNYSSRPYIVTVKLTTHTLINISGV